MSVTVTTHSCSFCKKTTVEVKRFFFGYGGRMCSDCLDKLVRTLATADPQWRERTIAALIEARSTPPRPEAAEVSRLGQQAEMESIRLS